MNNITMTTLKIKLFRILYYNFVQIYVAGRNRHGRLYKYIYYILGSLAKTIKPCPSVRPSICPSRDTKFDIKVPLYDTQIKSITNYHSLGFLVSTCPV